MRSEISSSHSNSLLSSSASSVERDESLTPWLLFSVAAITIGSSFQLGYHIGCINAPSRHISAWILHSHNTTFHQELSSTSVDLIWSATVSLFAVGGMIGGIASGRLADHFGRKRTLLAMNVIVLAAIASMVTAKFVDLYPLLMLSRLLIGLEAGVITGVVPMYITEISPTSRRGAMGSVNQLMVTVAILIAQVVGLPQLLGNEERWPFIFAFPAIPMLLQVVTLPFCPESPKFNVLRRHKDDTAERDLRKLRGEDDVLDEIDAILKEADLKAFGAKTVGIAAMFRGFNRWPTVLVTVLMAAQQLSGINAAMFYSTRIFERELNNENAAYATLGIGVVNVLQTLLSLYLVDRFGRRPLLSIGFAGIALSAFGIFGSVLASEHGVEWAVYLTIAFVFTLVIAFATGPGSIPFFYATEIFGNNERLSASAIVAFTNWFFVFVVGIAFLPLNNLIGGWVFFFFAYICVIVTLLIAIYLPETKNRSLQDIDYDMESRKPCFVKKKPVYYDYNTGLRMA